MEKEQPVLQSSASQSSHPSLESISISYTQWIIMGAFLLGILYLLDHLLRLRKLRNQLPPGPVAWPLVGNLSLLGGPNKHHNIFATGKKYGGIFTLAVGERYSVWLTSYRFFREAVIDHAWEFAGRAPESGAVRGQEPGIFASGITEDDREVRKFTLVSLRSFGFGKSNMQEAMLQETDNMVAQFRNNIGTPFNPRAILANGAGNVISSVTLGKTFQQGDEHFRLISETLTKGVELNFAAQRMEAFPLLKYFKNTQKLHKEYIAYGFRFLQKIVDEHLPTRTAGEPRDFIDTWMDHLDSGNPKSKDAFMHQKLPSVLLDLFTGGFETTTTTFQWIFAMLLHHPDVQNKIHQELDEEIGRGTMVTLDQRDSLVYIEAVILETLRMFPLVPFSVTHFSTEEATIGEYNLPKGTRVILHLYSIHHDPELWDQPEMFIPERFLKDKKLVVPDCFVPFGAGRRVCLGEQLARKELFLFFANIMQNFRILLPLGKVPPSLELNDGVVMYPHPYEIDIKER